MRLSPFVYGETYCLTRTGVRLCAYSFAYDWVGEVKMGALPAVSKCVRVDHHYSAAADPNMQIRHFFQYSGTLSTADATTWLTNITSAMQTMVVSQFANAYGLVGSQLTDLSSNTAPQVVNSTTATGTAGTASNPAGVAMVIKQHIARRYRGGHPRVYMPGTLSTGLLTVTQWSNTYANAWLSAYQTYIAACVANTNPAAIGTITSVNISFYQGYTNHTYPSGRVKAIPTPRVTPLIDAIISTSSNVKPGSQRRRNEQ